MGAGGWDIVDANGDTHGGQMREPESPEHMGVSHLLWVMAI